MNQNKTILATLSLLAWAAAASTNSKAVEFDADFFNASEFAIPSTAKSGSKGTSSNAGRRNGSELGSVRNSQGRSVPKDLDPAVVEDLIKQYPVVLRANTGTSGKYAQTLRVYQNGELIKTWLVSSGLPQHQETLPGVFHPIEVKRCAFSRTYDDAPMHFMVRFNGGIAMHQTLESNYRRLGDRASHGCVRQRKGNAEFVFNLVNEVGSGLMPYLNRDGSQVKNRDGTLMFQELPKALVVIDQVSEGDISERAALLSEDMAEEHIPNPRSRASAERRGSSDYQLCNP